MLNGKAAIWSLNFLDVDSKDKYHCLMSGISIHRVQERCLLSETFSSTVMGNENNPKPWHLWNIPQMFPTDSDNCSSQCPVTLQRQMDHREYSRAWWLFSPSSAIQQWEMVVGRLAEGGSLPGGWYTQAVRDQSHKSYKQIFPSQFSQGNS